MHKARGRGWGPPVCRGSGTGHGRCPGLVPSSSRSECRWNGALEPAGAAARRPGEGSPAGAEPRTATRTASPGNSPQNFPGEQRGGGGQHRRYPPLPRVLPMPGSFPITRGLRREVSPALPAAPGPWGPRGAYLAAEHLQRIRVTDQPEAPAPRPALLAQVEKDDGGQRRVGQRLRLRVAAARLPVPRPRLAPGPGQVIKADEILGSARLRILLGGSRSIFVHPLASGPGGAGARRGEPVGRLRAARPWRGRGAGGCGEPASAPGCHGRASHCLAPRRARAAPLVLPCRLRAP